MQEIGNNLNDGIRAAEQAVNLLLPVFSVSVTLSAALGLLYRFFTDTPFLLALILFSALSFFGTTIGVFMGASKSPIVSSILPPVITLVSGYMAYLANRDLPKEHKELIPGAVLLFLFNLTFSTFYLRFWLLPDVQ